LTDIKIKITNIFIFSMDSRMEMDAEEEGMAIVPQLKLH
jgi:hypothetical protein